MDEAFAHLKTKEETSKDTRISPDGGWGYLVCLGVGFTFMLGFGSSNAFGILFNTFFLEEGSASGLPLVIGIYNGALSISDRPSVVQPLTRWKQISVKSRSVLDARQEEAYVEQWTDTDDDDFAWLLPRDQLYVLGFLSGIALKKFSYRQVGLVGAGLFVAGDLLTIFVNRTYQLAFAFGVIRGAGFGVMIPVSFTAFNCYFDKKRTAMMSANQTMSSMASITFPVLVTFLLSEYGFRWTLALIMAIDLHLVFAMLVMHPVEWHLVDSVMPYSNGDSELPKSNPKIRRGSGKDRNEESVVKILADEHVIEVKPTPVRHKSYQKSIMKMVYDNVELDLLKDPRFLSTLVGLGFAFVSDVTYLAMEPMLLFSYGYTKMQVATCVMIGAVADLVARFCLAIFTYFYTVDSKKIFFVGTCITTVLRVALVMWDNLIFITVITAISGLVRCSVQVMFPLVLVSAAPDRFPAALALHILFSGFLMLIADPLIGIIYHTTGSYVYCFMAMSFCCLVCVVIWIAEFIVQKKRT